MHFTIIGSDFPGDGQQCIVDSHQHICISECISLFSVKENKDSFIKEDCVAIELLSYYATKQK